MTIGESQVGTVVRCDRCGRIIETISGSQFANRSEPASSYQSGDHHADQPSSIYKTPSINANNSEHPSAEYSNSEQAGLETEKNQSQTADQDVSPNSNSNSNSNATIAVDNNPTEIDNKALGKYNSSDSATSQNLDSKNLPQTANDSSTANVSNNKIDSKYSDDFSVNPNAKKSTIVLNEAIGGYGTNKKADWKQLLSSKEIKSNEQIEVANDSQSKTPPVKTPRTAVGGGINNEETIFASHSENKVASDIPLAFNAGSGFSSKSAGLSDAGRFGSTINLDLTKRVMGTINKSGGDKSDSADSNDNSYGVHRIIRQHQRGGMGRIMIAYDRHLKRDVALKELHKEVIDDISIVRRFVGEAEITAQLEHPGIVPIHWLGLDKDGLPYYTMKLIKGKTYQDAIKEYHRNPSKQELKNLIRRLVSICKTIGFAHERGVIHRDLKPANIMLGEHGETLVMDWGLAKPLHQQQDDIEDDYNSAITKMTSDARTELTMVGAIVGTPAFMSPEQASPEDSVVGTHSDIYSLGTILYYLLAGQTAFSGRSTREVLAKVRAASPIKPSEIKLNVPAGLEAICMKAMAKDPKDRYQTTKEMDEDLCRWLDNIPVKAMRITPIQKFFRWLGRHWIAAITIPLVIILITMLTMFIIKFDRSHNAIAVEESRRIALEDEVDLTEQDCVIFRGGHNIEVEKQNRFIGGKMVVCTLKAGSDVQAGVIEILAPSDSTWDLTNRRLLRFFVFEYSSSSSLPLDNLKIRLGRGSAYFEYQPSKSISDWWSKRRYGNWYLYEVPLDDSPEWPRTISDRPQFETIDWIEFHFKIKPEDKLQIDDIKFLQTPQ
ncbi:MAG: serine/threonine protein kinase [Planctomycetaceae bacterium]|jgi:serine/threonine protein kinase|nr:serine/threonine protein kinase [Planctomycetaceae bacterium]